MRTNKAELHHPRPFGFDAPAQAKAGIGRSWTETGGGKPGFRPNRYRGFVGFSIPGITDAPGMKMKSFARRSDSPMKIEPSAAVAIASN